MKSPSRNDEQPQQSLFSLLLEIENRLRTETRGDSLLQAKQPKLAQGKNYKRPAHLSRAREKAYSDFVADFNIVAKAAGSRAQSTKD
jgi:hypothetical protein